MGHWIRMALLAGCSVISAPALAMDRGEPGDSSDEFPPEGVMTTPVEARSASAALPGSVAGREGFVGLFGGNVTAADTDVVGTYQCYFCAPVTDQATVHFSGGPMAGVRVGMWGGGSLIMAGVGLEFSNNSVSADNAKLEYQSIGVTPMLRLPLWRTAAMPGGHVTPYAGFILSRANSGDFSVSLPALPRPLAGGAEGSGAGELLGVAIKYRSIAIQLEFRSVSQKLSLDSFASDEADLKMQTRQALLGINYLVR